MNINTHIIIDFDSTFVTCETLEEIARMALKDNPKRKLIYQEICKITNMGMDGKISFEESLQNRLQLIKASKDIIEKVIKLLKRRVTPSIKRNKKFFLENRNNIYIVTGAFKECVLPVVKSFGIDKNHVLANTFTYDQEGNITGVDTQNPLAGINGKYLAVRSLNLNGKIVVIGDGYTDFQIKELGAAEVFVSFIENIRRDITINNADYVADTFDSFLNADII